MDSHETIQADEVGSLEDVLKSGDPLLRDNESQPSRDKSTTKVKACVVCGTPLIEPGECAGTGMCGPCCTGDASTAGEY